MPVTDEPRGLTWINNVNMSTFGSLITNFCWLFGSVSFTIQACRLFGAGSDTAMPLALALLGAWGVKTGAGVVDAHSKRQANPAYAPVLEAKERAAIAGAAASVAIADKAADAQARRRRFNLDDDPHPPTPINITARDKSTVELGPDARTTAERAALPVKPDNEPNALTDDERGD